MLNKERRWISIWCNLCYSFFYHTLSSQVRKFNLSPPEPSQFVTTCPNPFALRSGKQTTPLAKGSDDQLFLQMIIKFKIPRFKYKVVTDNCEHAFWEECEDQTKKVPFHVGQTFFFNPPFDFTFCWESVFFMWAHFLLLQTCLDFTYYSVVFSPFHMLLFPTARQWSRSAGRPRRSGMRSAGRSPSQSTWCAGLAW